VPSPGGGGSAVVPSSPTTLSASPRTTSSVRAIIFPGEGRKVARDVSVRQNATANTTRRRHGRSAAVAANTIVDDDGLSVWQGKRY